MKTIFLGFIFILINLIFVEPVLSGNKFYEERLGIFNLGVNDGIINTEIFPLATNAQQGMAYIRFKGKESLFITVRAAHNSRPDKGQACRIVQFDFRPDGSLDLNPVCFTKLLPIGHGQGFGATVENGNLYFYCQSHYTTDDKFRFKGVSRVRWRGIDTDVSDIEEIPLLPSSGKLANYRFLTPNVSIDGKNLVTLCSVKGGGHVCIIWKMSDLKAYAKPINIFQIKNGVAKGQWWQGLCADKQHIYFVHGHMNAIRNHAIAIYDYGGNLIKEFLIEDEKKVYGGNQGIKSSTKFLPWNIELEGIAIRENDLLITGVCTLSDYGDVVSWRGNNYACFRTTDGTISPNNPKNWIPTYQPATKGEFVYGKIYESGRQKNNKRKFLAKYKYIYRIKNGVLQP